MSIGLYFHHPVCLEHDPRVHMPGHPDTPARLQAIEARLDSVDWLGWERRECPPAEREQLELIHSAGSSTRSVPCAWPAGAPSTPTRSSASPPIAPRCMRPVAHAR